MTYPNNPPSAPAHAPQVPWYKRLWFIITAVAIVALIIGTAIGGSGKSKAKAEPGPTVIQTQTTVSTAPAPPASTVTLKPTVLKTIATRTHVVRVTYTPPPQNEISDGIYKIGTDVPSGTYRTKGGSDCYFAILNSTDSSDIDDNNNSSGPQIVTLHEGKYFEVDGGCTWSRTNY